MKPRRCPFCAGELVLDGRYGRMIVCDRCPASFDPATVEMPDREFYAVLAGQNSDYPYTCTPDALRKVHALIEAM